MGWLIRTSNPQSWVWLPMGSRHRKRGKSVEGWETVPSHWRGHLRGLKLVSARANSPCKWLLPCTGCTPTPQRTPRRPACTSSGPFQPADRLRRLCHPATLELLLHNAILCRAPYFGLRDCYFLASTSSSHCNFPTRPARPAVPAQGNVAR